MHRWRRGPTSGVRCLGGLFGRPVEKEREVSVDALVGSTTGEGLFFAGKH